MSGTAPVSGASSVNTYIPVQPVRKVVPSEHGAPPRVTEDTSRPQPARTPSPGSGRLLDIRV